MKYNFKPINSLEFTWVRGAEWESLSTPSISLEFPWVRVLSGAEQTHGKNPLTKPSIPLLLTRLEVFLF